MHAMKGKTTTSSAGSKAKRDPKFGKTATQLSMRIREKQRAARECRRSRHEANRGKRQELGRRRDEAKPGNAAGRSRRSKAANRERLTGKGLFYCGSAEARMKEIQRRRSEIDREISSSLASEASPQTQDSRLQDTR